MYGITDARLAREAARLRVKGDRNNAGQAQAEERPIIGLVRVKSLTTDMRPGRGRPKCLRSGLKELL